MNRTLIEALEKARQLEIDGAKFYMEAAKRCTSQPARRLFESFAADEQRHLRVVEDIAKGLEVDLSGYSTPKEEIKTLFSTALEEINKYVEPTAAEKDAIRVALEKETESHALYHEAAGNSEDERTRKLLERLAQEEHQHYEMLENTLEYLNSNGRWFLWNEWALLSGDQSSLG